jgi:glyoxylase-like metal-dependent hydrolase (beta-lactamase superfamily II)
MIKCARFIGIVVVMGMSLSAQQRQSPPVELKQISTRLYEVIGGRGANGGAYIGDDGVLLIDSKMDKKSVDQTLEAIQEVTDKPIRFLVNTHSDGDHVAGNRYFPRTIPIIAHENCRNEFFHATRNGSPSEWNKPELAPFVPSLTFRDRMNLFLGEKRVELWYFGVGHTTGDAVVYFPEERVAFLGDQVFFGRPQLIHSYKGGNSLEHVKTVAKLLETLDVQRFCTGHSEIQDRRAIQTHLEQMKNKQEKVRALVQQGKSLEEVKSAFAENEARLIETIYNEIKKD